jgi:hypothetical protein
MHGADDSVSCNASALSANQMPIFDRNGTIPFTLAGPLEPKRGMHVDFQMNRIGPITMPFTMSAISIPNR